MRTTIKLVLLISFMAASTNTNAQWLKKMSDRLIKKAEKKTEQRLEEIADKKTDKALDSLFKDRKKKKDAYKNDSTSIAGMMKGMSGMMGKDVATESQYVFHTTITMDRFGDGVMGTDRTMIQRLGENSMLTEVPLTKMIIDTKNKAIITLLEDTKEAQVMSMAMMEGFVNMGEEDGEEDNLEKPVISSLGTTIVIAGYKCQHKSIETSTERIDLWYTDELDIDMSAYMNMFAALPNGLKNSPQNMSNMISGFVMQMDFIDKKTDVFHGTKVKEISFKKTVVNMSDYKLLKF
ncbi:MAG: DUF4412 domain-containing protein [Nonlabens sp.]